MAAGNATRRTSYNSPARLASLAVILVVAGTAPAAGQGRTDVVTLANGDRITGEVSRLERGRLEFETDDAGTLYLEWDKLRSVVATLRLVEVVTGDGRRFLGTLGPASDQSLAVVTIDAVVTLAMHEVTFITPIGRSFWKRIDGAIDLGFSYTRSSGVAQLNLNSATIYRRPAWQARLSASGTLTRKDDDSGRDDRASIDTSYLRSAGRRWYLLMGGRFETNESLGLVLRSQGFVAAGPRLVNSNRALLAVGAGLGLNNERGVDVEPSNNVEAMLLFTTSFFTYDRPKTNLDLSVQYYPSLSDTGRHRVQFDASIRRELFFKDFFVAVNGFNSFDSRPPNPEAANNDVGVVWSIGWSY